MEADLREQALARRHILKQEQLSHSTKPLPPLATGDLVRIQDQATNKQPGKWTQTGKIVEVQKFDSYLVKIDGSRTVTKRNSRLLRRIVPFINASDQPQPETNPQVSPAPALPATPTPTPSPTPLAGTTPPSPTPSYTRPPKPTSRQPVKERWIVTKKSPTKVSVIPTNNVEEPRDGAVPNDDDDVLPISAPHDDNHVNVPADATAATSTNIVSSTPIPFPIIPKPPGTRHDYEEMTRDAARARAEVTRGRL